MGKDAKQINKVLGGVLILFALIIGFLVLKLSLFQIVLPREVNLVTIFLTGLVTGGLTCLAVQGGLLASTVALEEQEKLKEKTKKRGSVFPIVIFLISKLGAYTFLGLLLGWFGSLFQLSLTAQIVMQVVVIVFMLGTALNILDIHPIFRYFVIQPPRFITRRLRNQSKRKSIFTPAILGAFTVFIPCGTTQAMMALAIGSGSALFGALILFAFILGTTPLFFILGYFAVKLGGVYQRRFMKIAAVALFLLVFFNLKNVLGLAGVNFNLSLPQSQNTGTQAVVDNNPTIEFRETSYSPRKITVAAGSKVKLTLKNVSGGGCIQSFVIPKLGIQKVVKVGSFEVVEFTAPSTKGQLAFMCSMGMYRGVIDVI